ncbi:MAG: site-specific integrase [Lachnospiraceae bacterium]|jgi:integrase|nr:site-specific integrase [Lachnospiraceae bacterium]
MTGSLHIRKTKKGQVYDAVLSYLNPNTGKWVTKWVSLGMPVEGHRKAAKDKLADIIDQYSYLEKKTIINKDILLTDYLDFWVKRKKGVGIRSTTYEGYIHYLQHAIDYFRDIRPIKLVDATFNDWQDYFNYQFRYGNRSQKDGSLSGLSVRSVRSQAVLLKDAMSDAIIDGLINVNWIGIKKIGGKRTNKSFSKPFVLLSKKEIVDYLMLVKKMYPELLPMAYIVIYYGFRRSEILGLKWDMVDFDRKTIHISRTITRMDEEVENDETKTPAGNRECEFLPNTEELLSAMKRQQEENRTFYGDCWHDDGDYVFRKSDGEKFNADFISKAFKKIAIAYGRPELTLHKLRHSCASILHELGWGVKKTAQWLGHADCSVTLEIYTHIEQNRSETELKGLNNELPKFTEIA